MSRTPRAALAAGAIALGAVVVLVVASVATSRSQAAPMNTKEPYISAQFLITVGSTIQGHKGSWSGTEPITYAYQWLRCDDNGQSCVSITNAVNTTYKVVSADAQHTLRFQVTASNKDGKATAKSNATPEIPKGPGAPSEQAPPTISGQAEVGKTLTATTGTWKGTTPISYTFRWQVCNSSVSSCTNSGATGNSYTIPAADVGKRLRVKVLAKNAEGETAGLSDPTDVVKASGSAGPSVPVESLVGGDRLVVDTVSFNPNPVTSTSQPVHVTIKIKDNKGKLVRGAEVSIVSTPVRTSTPTPTKTDSAGIVVYTIQPRPDFLIKTGFSTQFYVKAYRAGEPTLAGVSGGRLVQVATQG
jgi:hypothetical protein